MNKLMPLETLDEAAHYRLVPIREVQARIMQGWQVQAGHHRMVNGATHITMRMANTSDVSRETMAEEIDASN